MLLLAQSRSCASKYAIDLLKSSIPDEGEGVGVREGGRERKSTFALNNKLRLLLTLLRIHRLTTTQLSIETIHENVSLQLRLSTTRNSALAE